MITKGLDKTKLTIGLVHEIYKDAGATGYEIDMIIRSKIERFPCTEEVYSYIDNGRFGQYPNAAELFYALIFDAKGTVVQLMQADKFQNEENSLIVTDFSFGTYAMFSYPIEEDTLKSGDFLTLDGNIVRLCDDFNTKKDSLVHMTAYGAIQNPKSRMTFKMADDFDIYTWDWSEAKKPFSINCTREEAIANDFISHFKVGKPEDVTEAYWIVFSSLRGDDKVIDTVCCFKNKAPGWEY